MVSLTLLAALGIGGFVAYKVVGAVSPKIQVSMPSIALPESIKLAGLPQFPDLPTAEGIKEALSGLTDPLQRAVATLEDTAGKIPDPSAVKDYIDQGLTRIANYGESKWEYIEKELGDLKEGTWNLVEELKTTVEEAPGKFIKAGEEKVVGYVAGAGELLSSPLRAIGLLPEPEQVDKMGAFAFIPFAGLIDKWLG